MSQSRSALVGAGTVNPFTRYAHVIAYVSLAGAIAEVVGYELQQPTRMLWAAVLLLALCVGALILLGRRRSILTLAIFLVVGGFTQYAVSLALFSDLTRPEASASTTTFLVPVALTLVTGMAAGLEPWLVIVLSVVGFAVGQLASLLAARVAGMPAHLDALALGVTIGLIVISVILAATRRRRIAVRSELDRAVVDEEMFALRYRIEVRAATLMHDMVLSHLAAVATSVDGSLPPKLKGQIENDLAVLIGEEWLSDPEPEVDSQSRTDWRRSALLKAVQEARDLALTVEVTGDFGSVGRMDRERDTAVGLAVKQCLVNVLRHAGVDRAEVVIIGSDEEVTVMVIDTGRGFSEQQVASDRLGIRQSVRRRIESVGGDVQLWSTPGRGTSVMIRVPADQRKTVSDDAD